MMRKTVFRVLALVIALTLLSTVAALARWQYMDMGETYFAEGDSPNELWASGSTYGYRNCDEIGVTVSIQKFYDGEWTTVASDTFTNHNTSYVAMDFNAFVERGYTYRAISDHWVTVGDVTERTQSDTTNIYVPIN